MRPLVVLGAGGHAKVVAELAALLGHDVLAFVDEGGERAGTAVHGIPVVASLAELPDHPVALGIGDNRARWARYGSLAAAGRTVAALVHPGAIVSRTVVLGAGTVVMAGVVINADARVGTAAVLNTASSTDHDCRVGNGSHLAPGSRLAGGVTVGTGVLVGLGAVVLPLRSIGDWAVCGAGSVVVHDVEPGRTVKGAPAR